MIFLHAMSFYSLIDIKLRLKKYVYERLHRYKTQIKCKNKHQDLYFSITHKIKNNLSLTDVQQQSCNINLQNINIFELIPNIINISKITVTCIK